VEAIHDGSEVFHYLDAVQLLKHSLGMSTQFADHGSPKLMRHRDQVFPDIANVADSNGGRIRVLHFN